MRKPIIAGNWKMNKDSSQARELAGGLRQGLGTLAGVDIILCPPFTALSAVAEAIQDSDIKLGAQDMHWEEAGAYTGEISAEMLKDSGCSYVIIGHSERRQYFGETNESVNKKLKAAFLNGLLPIMCIGETLSQRQANETFRVIENHLGGGLQGLSKEELLKVTIAYEPVWAIGTGKTATPQQAQEVHRFIRKHLEENYGREVSQKVRIQYGGSIKPDNIAELMQQPDVDGGLVGGASLKIESFSEIVNEAAAYGEKRT